MAEEAVVTAPVEAPSQPAGSPDGTPAAHDDTSPADAGAERSATTTGADEGDQDEPEDELEDEVVGAVYRRYKDRPAIREEIQREARQEAARIIAEREQAARTRPDVDPAYVELAQKANGSLTQLNRIWAQARETGETPDEAAVNGLMGNYGRFVEHREQQAAYAVFTNVLEHLAGPARAAVEGDEKLLGTVDKLWGEAQQVYSSLASPDARPENRKKAFGEFSTRALRAFGELKLAEGAAQERKRADRERRDRDITVRENERIRLAAEGQANGNGSGANAEPRPRRAPRPKTEVLGAKDLKGNWKQDREKLRAAGIRI